jgi:hypothetical protein
MRTLLVNLAAGSALAMAAPAMAQQDAECDRACLIAMADAYAAALVAHEADAVPLAPGAVMVENQQPIAAGAGLWQSLTRGPSDYLIHVADPVSQQVGTLAMMEEAGGPVMVGIRLKRENGRITEAEHMVARDLSEGQLANLQAPRPALLREVPEVYADSRGRMLWLGRSYYDALDNNNSQHSAMADDCERQENGFQTARNRMVRESGGGNGQFDEAFAYLGGLGCAAQMDTNMWAYISRIENRRVDIADPVTGLVWGSSHLRHDFETKDYPLYGVPGFTVRHMDFQPFDMPAIHIYKVWGGKIHEIEALGLTMPYQTPFVFAAAE